jgi:stearoyl-CoA desaturase (delta-9 desaturase)
MAKKRANTQRTGSYSVWAIGSMAAVHVIAVVGVWLAPATWPLVALCAASYALRMFGITAGYHRYFAHRAYRTSRAFQFVLAFLGGASMQRGALWWAAHHRDHHRYSDLPGDLHSPIREGFWWSHVGWIVHSSSDATEFKNIKDFRDGAGLCGPELNWLNRWHLVPPLLWALALFVTGGLPALIWGFFVATVLLWHGTFMVNSLAHVWGTRRFATTDTSRNNAVIAFFTLGEGWHNNHHHYQSSARQGFVWWEFDASFYVLTALSWIGVVWQLKAVPDRVWQAPPPASEAMLAAAEKQLDDVLEGLQPLSTDPV